MIFIHININIILIYIIIIILILYIIINIYYNLLLIISISHPLLIYMLILILLFLILRLQFNLFLECCLYFWFGVFFYRIFFTFQRSSLIWSSIFLIFFSTYFNINTLIICSSTFLFLIISNKLTYGRRMALKLGALSYPIYLTHIPVQIIILIVVDYFNLNFDDQLFIIYLITLFFLTLLIGKADKHMQITLKKRFL